ncbi:MAG TPA: hypothetical protein V6D06_08865 [Trichocoleus sp.]
MMTSGLTDIKWERLFLAVAITFLLADNIPHPQLGSSLSQLAAEQVQSAWAKAHTRVTTAATATRS